MRALAFLALAALALPVQAQLYRWIDPQTGSVKFSSYPPPWQGVSDAPAVEVIRYEPPAPPKPAAQPPRPGGEFVAALEAQWKQLVQFFNGLASKQDFQRAGGGLQQQLEAYQALSAELDRIDPAGAARRRAEEAGVIETIRKGLAVQFSLQPPQAAEQ